MQFNNWMNKDDWSKQICQMHLIEPKLRIISMLHDKFGESGRGLDTLEFGEYAGRQTLRTNIACQILALEFELTEDLAATCFSYAKAVKQKTKNVPEYLRDFGDQKKNDVGNPREFYKKASENIIYASEMVGIDPVGGVGEAINSLGFFKKVKEFRYKYDDWYQGYKHGQRILAMYAWPSNQDATRENTQFILYRIPQEYQETNTQIFVEANFVSAIDEENSFFQIASNVATVWAIVKGRQFPKIFPNIP
jgi:hypothetical protein